MSFKLLKKDQLIILLSLHVGLLPLMIYLVECFVEGAGILSAPLFFTFLKKWWFVFFSSLLTNYLILGGKQIATFSLVAHNLLCNTILFYIYSSTNGKVAFFYFALNILISIIFIALWLEESSSAIYNPGHGRSRLGSLGNKHLQIKMSPDWGESMTGKLSAWSESSFFAVLDQNNLKIPPETVKFEIEFEKIKYHGEGQVISSFGQGLGIRVDAEEKGALLFHWKDLYNIIVSRGIY